MVRSIFSASGNGYGVAVVEQAGGYGVSITEAPSSHTYLSATSLAEAYETAYRALDMFRMERARPAFEVVA